jgi:hypothetical protein
MLNLIICFRYLVFALSIVCNAVIASVSVWNLGFAQESRSQKLAPTLVQVVQVDSFVIFVGGCGLVLIFTIVFVEVGRNRNVAVTNRVWFECLWSGMLFLLNICAASVVTALLPSQTCQSENLPRLACTSTKVLQSFTWLFTGILLAYFLTVFVTVFIRSGSDSRIWMYSMYHVTFDRRNGSDRLPSPTPAPPPSRMLGRFKPASIVAPRPHRPTTFNYRSGLSAEYAIEHFQLPSSHPQPPPPVSNYPRPLSLSLYPEYLRSSLPANMTPLAPIADVAPDPAPKTSPPPLGDWPRTDIMMHSSVHPSGRNSRRVTTRPTYEAQRESFSQNLEPVEREIIAASVLAPPPPIVRPSGPRTRTQDRSGGTEQNGSSNADRPPPLDLSTVSNLKPNR